MAIPRAIWVICVTALLAQLSVAQPQETSQPSRVTTFHRFFAPCWLGGRFPSILAHQAVLMAFREERGMCQRE
ncbi:MAG: hypothetical protein O2931_16610 [Planctomycetota bacterium]|nr:hypothetical protein [Planctomycetota bacterium]MDA1180403.1 hypothetical protein [Planctomycetota bacterium]